MHRHARSLTDDDEHECAETLAISEKFEHEAYDNITLTNDIALLRLARPPTCSLSAQTVKPLCAGPHSLALRLTVLLTLYYHSQ